jgi:hypothetical protein
METPITKAIKEFERLKGDSKTLKDIIYLDGVLAILDSFKIYEEKFLNDLDETFLAEISLDYDSTEYKLVKAKNETEAKKKVSQLYGSVRINILTTIK